MNKLKIAILSYRSAPFSGGQGIFVYELSKSLQALGHDVDVVSGPPYPSLEDSINLVKLPGLDLLVLLFLKRDIRYFFQREINHLMIGMNLYQHYLEASLRLRPLEVGLMIY